MKFKIGDTANGVKTSEEIIEANSYIDALRMVVEDANLYCELVKEEAEKTKGMEIINKKAKMLAKELRQLLTENILDRYDYPSYWDNDVVEVFLQDHQIREDSRLGKQILELLEE